MKKKEINSARVPVYRDAGFELFDATTTESAFRLETEHERVPDLYIYSRYRNPTIVSAEEEIMKLERCNWALLTQTGMSAIDTATSVFQRGNDTGPWLFFSEIYGGTISFIDSVLIKRRGLDVRFFTPDDQSYDLAAYKKILAGLSPTVVYVETISNPMLIVSDITEIIAVTRKFGSKIIVDNTFATPNLYRPLEAGADLVIHSATKYFSGHGDLTAGVICGNDKATMQQAIEYRKLVGHMLSPDDAYRLHTQVQSFELRFERQCRNALKLAGYLEKRSLIKRIWYPGLRNHSTHDIASRLFQGKGYGGMITFDFDGKDRDEQKIRRDKFIRLVSDTIKLIPTLGDSKTILMPIEAVWGKRYPEQGMIRLSVGFENYDDLESTVSKALDSIEKD
jgi:cystathionine beta-lyase/cystathionine gamma-synthase